MIVDNPMTPKKRVRRRGGYTVGPSIHGLKHWNPTFHWQTLLLLLSSVTLLWFGFCKRNSMFDYDNSTVFFNVEDDIANAKVFWVHVGKTGGTTIGSMLRILCDARWTVDSKQHCFEAFHQVHNVTTHNSTSTMLEESQLSQKSIGFLHVTAYFPPQANLDQATHLLVPLRHPVERVVSWFYYLNPRNCYKVDGEPTARSNFTLLDKACLTDRRIQKHPTSREARFYQDCFPTVEDFGTALSGEYQNDECTVLARETLEGYGGPQTFSGHLWANYSYYARVTHHQYPEKIVFGVRTNNLWDDLTTIDQQLGGSGEVFQWQKEKGHHLSNNNSTTTTAKPYEKGTLSQKAYFNLCCALMQDFEAFQDLVIAAVNLEDPEATLDQAFTKCEPGVHSLKELEAACRQQALS